MKRGKGVIVLQDNLVPILFTVLCAVSIALSGQNASFIISETVARVARNTILVASLILPVLCGMGLNFSIVLGAMAGEVGLLLITHWKISGLLGISIAIVIGIVLAIVLGALAGLLFNKVKGQEMIAGMILGFFAVGVYDLIFLFMVGTIIPMHNPEIMLSQKNAAGETIYVGLRNTIEFHAETKYAIDNAWKVKFMDLVPWLFLFFFVLTILLIFISVKKKRRSPKESVINLRVMVFTTALVGIIYFLTRSSKVVQKAFFIVQIPMFTALIIAAVCFFVILISKTKLGQDIRAVGMDMQVANASGINVNRTRMISTILSTVLASIGQIVFLQNIGNMQTFNSHEQVGTYAVAALLVGGASIDKATIGQVFTGTTLFHVLFFITPLAGKELFNDPQLGEYFRVFLCYGIIALSLILYARRKVLEQKRAIALDIERKLSGGKMLKD